MLDGISKQQVLQGQMCTSRLGGGITNSAKPVTLLTLICGGTPGSTTSVVHQQPGAFTDLP